MNEAQHIDESVIPIIGIIIIMIITDSSSNNYVVGSFSKLMNVDVQ